MKNEKENEERREEKEEEEIVEVLAGVHYPTVVGRAIG
jgi:hypothetical protein